MSISTSDRGRVLIVDDDRKILDLLVDLLELEGYEVMTAPDGAEAVALATSYNPDIVISDVVMAGSMDGIALARTIRERHSNVPVMLMTGYSQMAEQAGVEFGLLRKPFRLDELSRTTARMIAEAKQPPDSNVVRLRNPRS